MYLDDYFYLRPVIPDLLRILIFFYFIGNAAWEIHKIGKVNVY